MRSLIVLCSGNRVINNLPVFLNRHPDGKLLAEKAIEGIFVDNFDEIIFTVLKTVNQKYNVQAVLKSEIKAHNNIKIFELDEPSSGPAESVYLTVKGVGIEGEFAVRDSLNGIAVSKKIEGNFVAGLDLTIFEDDVFNVRSKSFIVTNEQSQVLDVIEKRFRSDIISVGFYGFKKASDFILAYEKLNDQNYPISKMYLSNVISYLIGYKQRVFHCGDVSFHEDWGTPETWNRLQKKYCNVLIDIDMLLGKTYSDGLLDELLSHLDILQEKSLSLILVTRSLSFDKQYLKNKLTEYKINCIEIVGNVSYSSAKMFVEDDDVLRRAVIGV